MKLEFKIGHCTDVVEVPAECLLDVLLPNIVTNQHSGEAAVRHALAHPVASPRLKEIVRPGESVAIVTSDITRPMPTAKVMPMLLDELYEAGVQPQDIVLVFALGSHRHHTEAERRVLAGERAWHEIRCVDSDAKDCIRMGFTNAGTPVDITRVVAQADHRICLGNIEYHYFAGYSGGAKAIMPGVSSREAIQANHRMMIQREACAGTIEGNPVRTDIEQAAAICGVDFILNVVLDEHKEIVCAVAGDVTAAHRAGCDFLDTFFKKDIACQADIVLVSQGGFPKDINLYQTQKALDNARLAVKPGGVIILISSCQEGFGDQTFEEWLCGAPNAQSLIQRIQNDFQLGGHKAAAIAMTLEDAEIYVVSDLKDELVRKAFMRPFSTAQEAYNAAVEKCGISASVLAMPYGGSTLPCIRKK